MELLPKLQAADKSAANLGRGSHRGTPGSGLAASKNDRFEDLLRRTSMRAPVALECVLVNGPHAPSGWQTPQFVAFQNPVRIELITLERWETAWVNRGRRSSARADVRCW